MEDKDRIVTLEDLEVAYSDVKEDLNDKADVIVSNASGSIASLSDASASKVKKAVFNIEPVQDLHGYDYPWPGGGGKNLLNPDDIYVGYFVPGANVSTLPTNMTSDNRYRVIHCSLSAGTYTISCSLPSANTRILRYIAPGGETPEEVDYTIPHTFTFESDGNFWLCFRKADSTAITEELNLQVEPGSSATAYAPYSNICPISGHTSVDANRTGVNLLEPSNVKNLYVGGASDISIGNNGVLVCFEAKQGVTYTINGRKGDRNSLYKTSLKPTELVSGKSFDVRITQQYPPLTFTADEDATYAYYCNTTWDSELGETYQIELGSTASSYESYQGRRVTYQLGQTVYSGTLAVNEDGSGSILSDMAMVDMGTMTWSQNAYITSAYNSVIASMMQSSTQYGDPSNIISDTYRTYPISGATELPNSSIMVARSSKMLVCRDDRFVSAINRFTTSVSGHWLYYRLAEPITIPLTAQEVLTLVKGQNNVWCDTGDTEISYRCDTKLYIDGKFAELQSLIANS